MLRGLFGENKKDALLRAKEEFESVCRLQGTSREVRAARIRMGIRCRAVIDETFVEGIEKCAEHLEQCWPVDLRLTGPGRVLMQSRSEDAFLGWLLPKIPSKSN